MRSTKKPNASQLTSTLMAIVMTATTTFQMPVIAMADETTQTPAAVVESTAEVTCEEGETSLPAEVDPSGEDTEESKANETRGPDEETAETTQIETEVETEAEKADPFAALDPSAGFTEEDLAAIDFSCKRLLIAADPAVIIDPEHVLSVYNSVYLMQYETESQAKYAYAYYYGKSEFR